MKFTYIDGDDIGLKIEKCFMNNDESCLMKVNNDVIIMIQKITDYLIANKYEIIFSGADGIICKSENINVQELLEFIREKNSYLSFSIGVGNCLRDSFLALRYAKSNGKNTGAVFDNEFNIFK
jgi:hypothetical protein